MSTATRYEIESPAWAMKQLAEYDHASEDYAGAVDAAFDARAEAARIRREVDAIEAEIVVNGGHGEIAITGSNKETREAQVKAAMQRMPAFQKAQEALRRAEREQAQADNEAQEAVHRMRRIRLALDWSTAFLNRAAATERGADMEDYPNGNHN